MIPPNGSDLQVSIETTSILTHRAERRANWRIVLVQWPNIVEDLSTRGFLQGAPALRGMTKGAYKKKKNGLDMVFTLHIPDT